MTSLALRSIDLLRPNGKPIPGLVSVHDSSVKARARSIDERAAVIDAQSFDRIDFVFFRRFSDGRSSQVAAYVVDNSDERLDEKKLAALHLQVWLHGTAPLLYVAWPARIDILTCARGADFWRDDQCEYQPARRLPVEPLKTAVDIQEQLRRFSAFRLADGTFWEDDVNRELADHTKAAHESLIQAVVEADKEIEGKKNPVLRRLLLLMVLIKYLEDRRVFPSPGWFGQWHKGARSFFDVLRGGDPEEVHALLEFLERKFNGEVFGLSSRGRKNLLTKKALDRFADFVEGRTLSSQRYLWKQFSFEHLPVEIISHLYQRFVQRGHGAVYTPPFLASLLLDQAMPYAKLSGEARVLDPACGSGVFLVGAFRRLINVWRSQNDWRKPDVETLKVILRKSIHGIELNPFAIDLSAFSLSLAICDALKPKVIWNKLKFDRLRDSNLFEADFFGEVLKSQRGEPTILNNGFDIVIGNPPFESKLTKDGAAVDKAAQQQDSERGPLPDKQAAYLFLEQAMATLRSNGRACLIQPSGFLYNRRAKSFRNVIFRKRQIDAIFDFTSIRKLYDADPKTVAVLACAYEPKEDHWINHWTFRRTASVHKRICFEIDHYDRHRVPQKLAECDPYVWRANLLGGGRLLEMSQRLREARTLPDYIQQNGWDYGEGFIAGRKREGGEETRKQAPFLTGKSLLPTEALTEEGIDEARIRVVTEALFVSRKREERFTPPLILIKEHDSLPIAFWNKGFLAYRDKIVGIHAPPDQTTALRNLYETLHHNRRFLRFCCVLNGTQSLVGKATAILKHDIDKLPYPKDFKDLSLSFWEKALQEDVLEYMTDYVRLGQNSQLLQKTADADDLLEYSTLFVRMLGSVYENLYANAPVFLDGLICQSFYFGERGNIPWLSEEATDDLRKLIYEEDKLASLRTIRVLRFYSGNILLLVKPNKLRYWIPSTAIRDADDTLVDLCGQGY